MRKILYILVAAVMLCFTLVGCTAAGYTVFENARVFSDDIIFSAQIMGGRASYAHSRMTELLNDIDKQVSLSNADSDLSRFNAAGADERVQVGEYTYDLFYLSLEYYALTNGAFNCAITPLTALWGVNSGFNRQNSGATGFSAIPTQHEIEQAQAHCDPRTVTASEEDGRYYLTKTDGEVKLDFGGIAKGYAVDKCVEILDKYDVRSALIDISGNAYFYGKNVSAGKEGDWSVGVTNPRPRGGLSRGYVAAVSLPGDVSAVTSGDYMRYRTADIDGGTVYIPHIISPNGMPIGVEQRDGVLVQTDEWVISATVVGSSSALCDALSTAVAALGLEAGSELLQKTGHKGLIFTEKRYTIIGEIPLYKPEVYDGFTEYAYYER